MEYKETNINEHDQFPRLFLRSSTLVRKEPKIGRNAPCPCGSGKNTRDVVNAINE